MGRTKLHISYVRVSGTPMPGCFSKLLYINRLRNHIRYNNSSVGPPDFNKVVRVWFLIPLWRNPFYNRYLCTHNTKIRLRSPFSTLYVGNAKITDYMNCRGQIWDISPQIVIVYRQWWKQFVTHYCIGIYVKLALSKKSGCTGYTNYNGLKREIVYWSGKLSKNAHCPSGQSYNPVLIFHRHLPKGTICSETLHPAASKQNRWFWRNSLCSNDLHRIFRKFAPRVRKCV